MVTAERNEIRDENTALQAEITDLQNELQARIQSGSMGANSMDMGPATLPQPLSTMPPMPQQPPVFRPVYAAPIQELQLFAESRTSPAPPTPNSNVGRPHARYPTPSDSSWPGQLLSSLPTTAQEGHLSSTSSINTASSREEGSDKA
ncbi:putative Transcription factor BHLH062 [Cocos nucifera]|nr:putative Transcription factor BHLH062 [Cocos nucifera]